MGLGGCGRPGRRAGCRSGRAWLNSLLAHEVNEISARVVDISADGNEWQSALVEAPLRELADGGKLPHPLVLRAVKPLGIKSEG